MKQQAQELLGNLDNKSPLSKNNLTKFAPTVELLNEEDHKWVNFEVGLRKARNAELGEVQVGLVATRAAEAEKLEQERLNAKREPAAISAGAAVMSSPASPEIPNVPEAKSQDKVVDQIIKMGTNTPINSWSISAAVESKRAGSESQARSNIEEIIKLKQNDRLNKSTGLTTELDASLAQRDNGGGRRS